MKRKNTLKVSLAGIAVGNAYVKLGGIAFKSIVVYGKYLLGDIVEHKLLVEHISGLDEVLYTAVSGIVYTVSAYGYCPAPLTRKEAAGMASSCRDTCHGVKGYALFKKNVYDSGTKATS